MEEQKTKKVGLLTFFLVLAIIVIIVMGVIIFKLYNDKEKGTETPSNVQEQVTNSNVTINNTSVVNNSTTSNETISNTSVVNNSTNSSDNKSTEPLYVYSSADNAAANGYPELLYVYEFNKSTIKFKYQAPWNNGDVEGTAKSTDGETYIYENGNKKIEILLNSMGENSLKITEYENNSMTSFKNLFK